MNNAFNLTTVLYVFLGGGVGSLVRYFISYYTSRWFSVGGFPIGTFIVNILGCLLIGYLANIFIKVDSPMKFLLITGFCGGFTTFSTFSLENYNLWQQGQYGILSLYVLLSVILGIIAVLVGFSWGK